jgi:hypothetical protein
MSLDREIQVKEDTRAAWASLWIERLSQDVHHAARMFAENPGFTAVAVLSIALGTGANVATFSGADGLLLRPLPVDRPGELCTFGSRAILDKITVVKSEP